jgi:hypothetical protein
MPGLLSMMSSIFFLPNFFLASFFWNIIVRAGNQKIWSNDKTIRDRAKKENRSGTKQGINRQCIIIGMELRVPII